MRKRSARNFERKKQGGKKNEKDAQQEDARRWKIRLSKRQPLISSDNTVHALFGGSIKQPRLLTSVSRSAAEKMKLRAAVTCRCSWFFIKTMPRYNPEEDKFLVCVCVRERGYICRARNYERVITCYRGIDLRLTAGLGLITGVIPHFPTLILPPDSTLYPAELGKIKIPLSRARKSGSTDVSDVR